MDDKFYFCIHKLLILINMDRLSNKIDMGKLSKTTRWKRLVLTSVRQVGPCGYKESTQTIFKSPESQEDYPVLVEGQPLSYYSYYSCLSAFEANTIIVKEIKPTEVTLQFRDSEYRICAGESRMLAEGTAPFSLDTYVFLSATLEKDDKDNGGALHPADALSAEEHFHKAAECYAFPRDEDEKKRLFIDHLRKAAELGNASAQNHLGICYYNGKFIEQDYSEAFSWFNKAFENGEEKAFYNLGICYGYGDGVEVDVDKALMLLIKASEKDVYGSYEKAMQLAERHEKTWAIDYLNEHCDKVDKDYDYYVFDPIFILNNSNKIN
jgi:hypothetical protein